MSAYAELAVTTNFSFLRGASKAEELVLRAKELGLVGLGIADRNSVAGVVRAHAMAKVIGFKIAVGARLVFSDGTPDILAYPEDRAAWGRLTRLLTVGKDRAEKGDCILWSSGFAGGGGRTQPHCHAAGPDRFRRADQSASPSEGGFSPLRLAGGELALSRRRPPQAGNAQGRGRRRACSADRRERCALSCARAPGAAGRRHLHPGASNAGGGRHSSGSQCRAASEIGRGDGAAFWRNIQSDWSDDALSQALPLLIG